SHDGVLMQSPTRRWTSFASVAMPNGDVPSMADLVRATLRTGSLRIVHTETFGIHYARTGQAWLRNVIDHRDEIVAAYPDEPFRRATVAATLQMFRFREGRAELQRASLLRAGARTRTPEAVRGSVPGTRVVPEERLAAEPQELRVPVVAALSLRDGEARID